MTTYRNDLASAHQRIADLERAARERERELAALRAGEAKPENEPTEAAPDVASSAVGSPPANVSFAWWQAVPPVMAVLLGGTILMRPAPEPLGELGILLSPDLVCVGLVGAGIACVALLVARRANGPTACSRALLALGGLLMAPFAAVLGLAAFEAAAVVGSVLVLGALAIGAVAAGIGWIRSGAF